LEFLNQGIIYRLRKIPSNRGFILRGGGPRPTIYGLYGAKNEKVAECINLHYRTLSPKYLIAEEIAQTILTDYLKQRQTNEISIIEIRKHIKSLRKPFVTSDLSSMVAEVLKEMGVKVWR